eukprot:CAMPEP_0118713656 /NCGR_PEP_ID=MMETSP0800-20121206/25667_1 /TAXON_ID=210618 ORGANISM="Striatella unipunctata, Strain CCMP2910" /NCGR_SAMPLE_ID=MMETSP0800 /ASSEMBLY_ACC=CAM_ASM_000638 /LENGTH=217 /DNA_ID=CAMNT_0006619191 /DNA_START=40 /DNA_END=693 /DNA_ORIENTATION=+
MNIQQQNQTTSMNHPHGENATQKQQSSSIMRGKSLRRFTSTKRLSVKDLGHIDESLKERRRVQNFIKKISCRNVHESNNKTSSTAAATPSSSSWKLPFPRRLSNDRHYHNTSPTTAATTMSPSRRRASNDHGGGGRRIPFFRRRCSNDRDVIKQPLMYDYTVPLASEMIAESFMQQQFIMIEANKLAFQKRHGLSAQLIFKKEDLSSLGVVFVAKAG